MFKYYVTWWWGSGDSGAKTVRAWGKRHAVRLATQLAKAQRPKAEVRGVAVTASTWS